MAQDAIINRWNINGDVYDIQDVGRGRPLGVATLDENGRVPYTQLPESAVEFKGYWDASTNTPTLHDGTGTKGDLYYVDVAGTQDLGSGTQEFYVGDRVLYDGSVWKNITGDLLERAQQLFDVVHPVGEIYVQYPQQKSPTDLYNNNGITSTWTLQTQYAGAFFRSSGGSSANFIEEGSTLTKQAGQNKYHRHEGTYTGGPVTNNSSHSAMTTITGGTHSHSITAVHNVAGSIRLSAGNQSLKEEAIGTGTTGSHSHSIDHVHSITTGYNGNSSDQEARPDNFTIQIWKRTA